METIPSPRGDRLKTTMETLDAPSEFRKHDHRDLDVIEINKDSLQILFDRCAKYASLPSDIIGYGGIAIALLSAAFLTETFHDMWTIPGAQLRSAFLMGGIAMSVLTIRRAMQWFLMGKKYTPEELVFSLLPVPSPTEAELILLLPEKSTAPTPAPQKKHLSVRHSSRAPILPERES